MANKIIILTAPSGSGKSSIAKGLMAAMPNLQFSVSAATRHPRAGEIEGVHYYFISVQDFQQKIELNQFAEWEKVYEGKYYGTLKSEIQSIWNAGKIPLLDIDVIGAKNINKNYPIETCSIFIEVPITELKKRLEDRGSETTESLQERLDKAAQEAEHKNYFHYTVINDSLKRATKETIKIVQEFLNK